MAFDVNFDELAMKTNIATDRLRDNINTYNAMAKLFPILEMEGQQVGLYGGTALNKVYFGKRQRLSYDLDLFCYSYDSTLKALRKSGAVEAPSPTLSKIVKNSRFTFQSVRLDLWEANKKEIEAPEKREAQDLLTYFNYLIPPVVVPTYSLEYLLANKTLTMAARCELKDIYDVWIGLQLPRNEQKYKRYLKAIAKEREIADYKFFIHSSMYTIGGATNYYKNKRVDVLYQPEVGSMIKDIRAALDK